MYMYRDTYMNVCVRVYVCMCLYAYVGELQRMICVNRQVNHLVQEQWLSALPKPHTSYLMLILSM